MCAPFVACLASPSPPRRRTAFATRNRKGRPLHLRDRTFIRPRLRSAWRKSTSRRKSSKRNSSSGPRADFLDYLRKHEKEEPVTIGPGGVFYITDHHHLARALYDIGVGETYCTIIDNLSDENQDAFWKQLEANNEVYLKDLNGEPITPQDLPVSVKDLATIRSAAWPGRCGSPAASRKAIRIPAARIIWSSSGRIICALGVRPASRFGDIEPTL